MLLLKHYRNVKVIDPAKSRLQTPNTHEAAPVIVLSAVLELCVDELLLVLPVPVVAVPVPELSSSPILVLVLLKESVEVRLGMTSVNGVSATIDPVKAGP